MIAKVVFKDEDVDKNVLIIKNSQFIHNTFKKRKFLSIVVLEPFVMSNNTVRIENCSFSYNNFSSSDCGAIIHFNLITNVFISNCKFYNNVNLTAIHQSKMVAVPVPLSTNIFIPNTNFTLIQSRRIIEPHYICKGQ